jgi:type IV secretory pathway VirB4 component
MDAARGGQGAQGSQQAPPPLQYVEDRALSRRWATMRRRRTHATCWWTSRSRPTSKILATACVLWATANRSAISRSRLSCTDAQRPNWTSSGPSSPGVFTNADGNLFSETYNQLNAYFATVPGNYALNLRKLYLLNTNYADLSFLFTILPGEKTNAHLGTEYLAVLETDNSTPYFLNLHNGEVAHTLILGMTGSGKAIFAIFMLQNAQKYAPLTFIFDIGGSFQSLTTIFGGSYLNVGQEARDFTINPFSLPQTRRTCNFCSVSSACLSRATNSVTGSTSRKNAACGTPSSGCTCWSRNQRTVSNFTNIIGELKERLHRWTRGGQYGFLFDNAEDTLSFRFQTFNFARLERCAGGVGAAVVLRFASGVE